jgi:predicted transcriptional regulator
MAEDIDFKNVKVMDVMSRSVVTASINDDLLSLIHLMKDSGVTRLPMVDEQGNVAGVLTAKNILQVLTHCFFEMTQISENQQENEQSHQH